LIRSEQEPEDFVDLPADGSSPLSGYTADGFGHGFFRNNVKEAAVGCGLKIEAVRAIEDNLVWFDRSGWRAFGTRENVEVRGLSGGAPFFAGNDDARV